jgi:hypothetical protein
MGRGLCFTAYGCSSLFYAAEFEGLPADAAFQRALRRATADLVDGRKQHSYQAWNLATSMAHPMKGALAFCQSRSMSTPAIPSGCVAHCTPCTRRRQRTQLETQLKSSSRTPLTSRVEFDHRASARTPSGYRLSQMC